MPGTRHPGRLDNESGSMLIELILAMLFLAVAVGALVSVYSASVVSLRHTSIEGNALTLVDRQIELYNTLPYAFISLDSTTIPGSTDSYTTAHSTDSTIPGALGQVTGTTVAPGSCTSPKAPQPSCATQLVAGPDVPHRHVHRVHHSTDGRQQGRQAGDVGRAPRPERHRRPDPRAHPERLRPMQSADCGGRLDLLRGVGATTRLLAAFEHVPDRARIPTPPVVRGTP